MFSTCCEKIKVLWFIIITNLIYMMNNLFWCKKSSKVLFCNKPMLKYAVSFVAIWMRWAINQYISIRCFLSSAFPFRMIRTRVHNRKSLFLNIWHYLFSSIRRNFTKKVMVFSFTPLLFRNNSASSYNTHKSLGFFRMFLTSHSTMRFLESIYVRFRKLFSFVPCDLSFSSHGSIVTNQWCNVNRNKLGVYQFFTVLFVALIYQIRNKSMEKINV